MSSETVQTGRNRTVLAFTEPERVIAFDPTGLASDIDVRTISRTRLHCLGILIDPIGFPRKIGGFGIPAGERVYRTSEITLTEGSETAQMAVYLLGGGIAFVAIDGTAKFGIGPLSKTLDFFEVIEISLENGSNDNTIPGPDIISERLIE